MMGLIYCVICCFGFGWVGWFACGIVAGLDFCLVGVVGGWGGFVLGGGCVWVVTGWLGWWFLGLGLLRVGWLVIFGFGVGGVGLAVCGWVYG